MIPIQQTVLPLHSMSVLNMCLMLKRMIYVVKQPRYLAMDIFTFSFMQQKSLKGLGIGSA